MAKNQRKLKNNQARNKTNAEPNAETGQTNDQQVCWICYGQLKKNNREQMPCGHDNYCKECMKKWSLKGKTQFMIAYSKNKINGGTNAATLFNNDHLFQCPTCRIKLTYFWPSNLGYKGESHHPKQVIAYLKFADQLGNDPASYITDPDDLHAHVPKQFKSPARCPTSKKIVLTIDPIWILIMKAIGKEINAGRTEFHWMKCNCNNIGCNSIFLASKNMKPLGELIQVPDIRGVYKEDTPPDIARMAVVFTSAQLNEHFNQDNAIPLDVSEIDDYF